ncbi:MAG: carboxypeptidase regulatory-like domain-containing protein [Terriglobales bacterium]
MKNAIVNAIIYRIIGASLLIMLSVSVFCMYTPTSVLAAPAQLFGRDPKKEDKTRLLTGKVLDGSDNPLPNAVVYLTNTHTRSVKTYIVGPEGTYRFPALEPSIDYEVYAQYNNRKSGTKTVSQFDDRSQVYISLKVDIKAENK